MNAPPGCAQTGSPRPAPGLRRVAAFALAIVVLLAAGPVRGLVPNEHCLDCHATMTGFAPGHDPRVIGCYSCHLGDPSATDAADAHKGMTLVPGNLDIVRKTCANAGCHPGFDDRVHTSPMSAMSGVIAVDKVAFGESTDLDALRRVENLDHSPADTHLRQLCASCHLTRDKTEPGPVTETSRGGGCSACHLVYDQAALDTLAMRGRPTSAQPQPPLHHPDISHHLATLACFGCHSRSGRISTNYEGWHETELTPALAAASQAPAGKYRLLEDGRVMEHCASDVHFKAGMACTDCHLAREVMGDGQAHAHGEEAISIACRDCHRTTPPKTGSVDDLDSETQTLVILEHLEPPHARFVHTDSGKGWYSNLTVDPDGRLRLVSRATGKVMYPKPPAAACTGMSGAHARLDCAACHTAWAPQCITCHTKYDRRAKAWDHLDERFVTGEWKETGGTYLAEPPALGILGRRENGVLTQTVGTFAPGMIMTLDRGNGKSSLVRLYAPVWPHTTATKARNCRSCHNDPVTLGYGRGDLAYHTTGGVGRWTFKPELPIDPRDGLPEDGWIAFLREPAAPHTTRPLARPFSLDEQQRILLVGACLTCHQAAEPRVARVFDDFAHYRSALSPRCVLPDWIEPAKPAAQVAKNAGRPGNL